MEIVNFNHKPEAIANFFFSTWPFLAYSAFLVVIATQWFWEAKILESN